MTTLDAVVDQNRDLRQVHVSFLEGLGRASEPVQIMFLTGGLTFAGYVLGDVAPAIASYAINSIGNGIGESLGNLGPYLSNVNVPKGLGMSEAVSTLSLGTLKDVSMSGVFAIPPVAFFFGKYAVKPLITGKSPYE